MAAFPPAADEQVTLANWRQHPFSEWAFRNVRELLPTANIARSREPAPLSFGPGFLEDVSFANPRGEMVSVAEALRTSHTDGIVVSHHGRIVSEWYASGLTPDTPHLVFSVSKSIAGTLGGILADRGKLDPDAPVVSYIPEMEGSVYGGGCTVRHLLDMSVGIRFDEDYMARDGDVMNYPPLDRMGATGSQRSRNQSARLSQDIAAKRHTARPHLPLRLDQHRRARLGL